GPHRLGKGAWPQARTLRSGYHPRIDRRSAIPGITWAQACRQSGVVKHQSRDHLAALFILAIPEGKPAPTSDLSQLFLSYRGLWPALVRGSDRDVQGPAI